MKKREQKYLDKFVKKNPYNDELKDVHSKEIQTK